MLNDSYIMYQIEIIVIVPGIVIHRCDMTSFPVPLTVIIISHHSDPIQVFFQYGHVVSWNKRVVKIMTNLSMKLK